MPLSTDAVILCGGLGTRLRPALAEKPKPMADVNGRPFLEILIDSVARQNFRRFILCTGYKADAIAAHFTARPGREYVFSQETEPLGTAGALKLCEPLCREDIFLALNGDSICPLNLSELIRAHQSRSALATIAVVPSGERDDGGRVDFGPDGIVRGFLEGGQGNDRFINAGVYIFDRRIFDHIPAGKSSSLESDILPGLAGRGLYAHPCSERLYDIGTPQRLIDFRQAQAIQRF